MYLPAVEALHLGSIPWAAVASMVLVARIDGQPHRCLEVTSDRPGLAILSARACEWGDEHQQRVAERLARGELSFAERLERAYRLRRMSIS